MRARATLRFAWAHATALALAVSASAVIIDSDTGTENTSAPVPAADDPGWINVGTIGGLTGVYLGGKFVLTANHVGSGNIVLDGLTYQYVPGTAVQLDNGDGTYADLRMFEIYPEPPLPALAIASLPPIATTPVTMIGHGVNRGPATSWDPNGALPPPPIGGYAWGSGQSMRWGTNTVSGLLLVEIGNTQTWSIETTFDQDVSDNEAQAAVGDSGGATFARNGSQWELAGILFAIGSLYQDQPPGTALYGNFTFSADLSFYRDQILDVMAMPEADGGLAPGAALVAMLARRRRAPRQSFMRSSTRR
jgi:Trypsin